MFGGKLPKEIKKAGEMLAEANKSAAEYLKESHKIPQEEKEAALVRLAEIYGESSFDKIKRKHKQRVDAIKGKEIE